MNYIITRVYLCNITDEIDDNGDSNNEYSSNIDVNDYTASYILTYSYQYKLI